ncbi:MAG TPA: hypothetical protein VK936_15225 [Longimicrobiales bacterium]|jgi:hypothetical protein|nr:hypothetical protein [Longimicrobiales bacterium]
MRKSTFVVGRSTGRKTVLVFVTATQSPIVGPWTVQAVVSTN